MRMKPRANAPSHWCPCAVIGGAKHTTQGACVVVTRQPAPKPPKMRLRVGRTGGVTLPAEASANETPAEASLRPAPPTLRRYDLGK